MKTAAKILIGSVLSIAATSGFAAPEHRNTEAAFEGLGWLFEDNIFGTYSWARGVSADGSVVVGISSSNLQPGTPCVEAYRWENGKMTGLGIHPDHEICHSVAQAVSADGSVVVGFGSTENVPFDGEATRWTEAGIEVLGDFPAEFVWSWSEAVSADGSVIVGRSFSANEAFLWTEQDGMTGLGMLPGGNVSEAFGISADGSVVVGTSTLEGGQQAFRWTAKDGMTGLGVTPNCGSIALGISPDGNVVVGFQHGACLVGVSNEALIWTETQGMTRLGVLPGGSFSQAVAVSAAGSRVVGSANIGEETHAFLWTDEHGMRSIKHVLEDDFGLDLSGWQDVQAFGISDDGTVIVGTAFNPDGVQEAWRAVVPLVSTPPVDLIFADGFE